MFVCVRLKGFGELSQFILNEWSEDIQGTMTGLLGGVGPVHALKRLGKSSSCHFVVIFVDGCCDNRARNCGSCVDANSAVQERWPRSARSTERLNFIWYLNSNGYRRVDQQSGADNPGMTAIYDTHCLYCFLTFQNKKWRHR